MAQIPGLQVGEVGVKIVLDTGIDLTTATGQTITYRKPNGVEDSFPAAVESPATDGKISYTTTAADDLDVAGIWIFQAEVTFGAAPLLVGEASAVRVKDRFEL